MPSSIKRADPSSEAEWSISCCNPAAGWRISRLVLVLGAVPFTATFCCGCCIDVARIIISCSGVVLPWLVWGCTDSGVCTRSWSIFIWSLKDVAMAATRGLRLIDPAAPLITGSWRTAPPSAWLNRSSNSDPLTIFPNPNAWSCTRPAFMTVPAATESIWSPIL